MRYLISECKLDSSINVDQKEPLLISSGQFDGNEGSLIFQKFVSVTCFQWNKEIDFGYILFK